MCRNWDVDSAKDEKVRAGVWESTPGINRSIKGETWEFCLILSGVVELTEDGQSPMVYKAGDCFIMKPGYTGTWRLRNRAQGVDHGLSMKAPLTLQRRAQREGQTASHAAAAPSNRSFHAPRTAFPYILDAVACCNRFVMSLSCLFFHSKE